MAHLDLSCYCDFDSYKAKHGTVEGYIGHKVMDGGCRHGPINPPLMVKEPKLHTYVDRTPIQWRGRDK
jgi:hypothetical protein